MRRDWLGWSRIQPKLGRRSPAFRSLVTQVRPLMRHPGPFSGIHFVAAIERPGDTISGFDSSRGVGSGDSTMPRLRVRVRDPRVGRERERLPTSHSTSRRPESRTTPAPGGHACPG
jgi:hypothetical protein